MPIREIIEEAKNLNFTIAVTLINDKIQSEEITTKT